MKIAPIFLLAVFGLTLPAFAQAPLSPNDLKIAKVEVSAPNTPEYQITGGQTKRFKLGKWIEMEVPFETKRDIPELTFKYTILLEGKLLDGEVTYANISEGKDHYAVMYVSPKGIDSLLKGKALSGASIENVWVEVTSSGVMLGKASLKQEAMKNLPHLAGMVLNKEETPFAPLYYDRYEAIKKAGR